MPTSSAILAFNPTLIVYSVEVLKGLNVLWYKGIRALLKIKRSFPSYILPATSFK